MPKLRPPTPSLDIYTDNTPKGEDCIIRSLTGGSYIHIDAAGASFRYSLEAAKQGRKEPSPRPVALENLKATYRTLGAWVANEFGQRVIDHLDEHPNTPVQELYDNVATEILKHMSNLGIDYAEIPVWQREAMSFTHVQLTDGKIHIHRVGDVACFIEHQNNKLTEMTSDPFHDIEGPYQKERTDILSGTLGHATDSVEFFCQDYAGFEHEGIKWDGLVKNRIDMIYHRGKWAKIAGAFQAILGAEDLWLPHISSNTFNTAEINRIVTSSDGVYQKGVGYGLIESPKDFLSALGQAGSAISTIAARIRTHEEEHRQDVYPDDMSLAVLTVKSR